ncbi:hypothetical protein DFH07DRAFT_1007117 [Mycena maculata]|uniref:O-methyltransferase C-terminal domain-containing protein n=1 Tax=Mycena maculata TaxID=230809 RepID=A0AAD7NPN6_9AGAR|nr:hypothetical protein DFH07DRAFT_1007117 [Mycena maculata]
MTFATLRALHAILGDALDEIEAVYAAPSSTDENSGIGNENGTDTERTEKPAYASPPPSPLFPNPNSNSPAHPTLDFPALDAPHAPHSPAEQLTAHPTVVAATNRILAAAGHIAATVQNPFLALCDAGMGYHLPSCLRLFEAAHVAEALRAGPMHVSDIARRVGMAGDDGSGVQGGGVGMGSGEKTLAHVLRLLATHHVVREVVPDVFAVNRISSLIDTGRDLEELVADPSNKYAADGGAIAAFVGLCTDELHKSSAYLTEAVFPGCPTARGLASPTAATFPLSASSLSSSTSTSPSFSSNATSTAAGTSISIPNTGPPSTKSGNTEPLTDPTRAPFNYAFGCGGVGYFAWLEGEGCPSSASASTSNSTEKGGRKDEKEKGGKDGNPNRFRLERFGRAMSGTGSWEAPGAVLQGASLRRSSLLAISFRVDMRSPSRLPSSYLRLIAFADARAHTGFDWASLPRGSTVVDVGGGIGSTSMLLASTFADAEEGPGLRFVIQDRPVVVEMGEKAWRDKCPELLESGAVRFQVHDFFTPQPIIDAAVFLLRVVLHDWPDAFAQRILLRLRAAAAPHTRLVLADWVLPLACVDDFGVGSTGSGGAEQQVEGAETTLAPAPLLANLGKASANAYWMDLTMQVTFNGQERTLRETVALAASAGWRVVRVTKAPGSLFGHIVAVPAPLPPQKRARAGSGSAFFDVPSMSSAGKARGAGQRGGGKERDAEMEMERERELEMGMVERASSRCGTPTFGSRVDLPSVAEARARFGGAARRPFGSGARAPPPPPPLKQAVVLTGPPVRKKKPSPLSVVPSPSSPSPNLFRPVTSPRPQPQQSPAARRMSQAPLFRPQVQQVSSPAPRQVPPPSPMSPRHPLSRRSSYAHLHAPAPIPPLPQQHSPPAHTPTLRHAPSSPVLKPHLDRLQQQPPSPPSPAQQTRAPSLRHAPSSPVLKQHLERQQHPSPPSPLPLPSRIPALARRASHAQLQLPQTELRTRSGSVVHPAMVRAAGGISGLGALRSLRSSGGGSLDFGRSRRRGDGDADSESADDDLLSRRASPVLLPARSVLAAAARIEHGIPRSPSPDP